MYNYYITTSNAEVGKVVSSVLFCEVVIRVHLLLFLLVHKRQTAKVHVASNGLQRGCYVSHQLREWRSLVSILTPAAQDNRVAGGGGEGEKEEVKRNKRGGRGGGKKEGKEKRENGTAMTTHISSVHAVLEGFSSRFPASRNLTREKGSTPG